MDFLKGALLLEIIATIYTDFSEKFGVPRQSGLVQETKGRIVFEKPYRHPDAVKGLEGFSHIWLLWQFQGVARGHFTPMVRPPRMGGNAKIGVFASRSPFRPNAIGLSSVRLDGLEQTETEGVVLLVSGADLRNGTPILDIKPYLPFTDSHPDARYGFAEAAYGYELSVNFPRELLSQIPEEKQAALLGVLRQDPRPAYQDDPARVYGIAFAGYNIRFTVNGDTLTVCAVEKIE